jgi:thymidine kinase
VKELGSLTLICGPMFSGKSEELIRRLRRAAIARQSCQLFKPAVDVRYGLTRVQTHSKQSLEATPVTSTQHLISLLRPDTKVIGIDEVQFFDSNVSEWAESAATKGKHIVLAGLDLDAEGKPFGGMPTLMALADEVLKLSAVCIQCGENASRTQLLIEVADLKKPLLGAGEIYEARCRRCHQKPHWTRTQERAKG